MFLLSLYLSFLDILSKGEIKKRDKKKEGFTMSNRLFIK